jgi:two-component system, NarL family, sensor kinase
VTDVTVPGTPLGIDPAGSVRPEDLVRSGDDPDRWLVVTDWGRRESRAAAGPRLVVVQVAVAAVLVIVAVAVLGALAARRLAEREAVDDARRRTDLFAEAVLQPVLADGLLTGDRRSLRVLDWVVQNQVVSDTVVRVKLWSADGRVLYSDEPRLIGQRMPLGEDERAALRGPVVRAEVTDLGRPENRYERGQGKLLEAYRQVRTSGTGTPLLFETYSKYDEVSRRSTQIWRGFAGLMVSSLLLLAALQAPLLWRLLRRIRYGQEQREALLRRAVDASDDERRRIAGTLHDGVVQDLAASSFALAGCLERVEREGSPDLARQLRQTVATVRGSIAGLRSLLVDIYPPNLASAGLPVALEDLAGPLRARGVDVHLDLPAAESRRLAPDTERLVYRIVHECLANVAKHAAASVVLVSLRQEGGCLLLDVVDDGAGFDAVAVTAGPATGHLGVRVLADLAREAGAVLAVRSGPGLGTWWQLRTGAS